ncbi:MAG: DNA double-strand break repair nuclease NurA [Tissierellia bacterium]|nr:DNA double-strand break repair nuclease NurA [Tissierellia bacterium]
MYNITDELKEAVSLLNDRLNDRLKDSRGMSDKDFRGFIEKNIGKIEVVEPAGEEILKSYERDGGIVCVDGSVNRVGGANPHYVDFFQGLAKSTKVKEGVFLSSLDSPMLDVDQDYSNPVRKDRLLAELEMKVAIEGIKKLSPKILMMDGSLLRYRIYSESLWKELKNEALERDIILMGLIKDIKTSMIKDVLNAEGGSVDAYDREMLFGRLSYREMISIFDIRNQEKKKGLSSAFLRSSSDPNVIGIDIISEQGEFLKEMASLVLSITPYNSRGVPLFIDITDNEVKIKNSVLRALLETGLDRRNLEVFIRSERDKR